MKRIHITEGQLEYCIKKLNEGVTVPMEKDNPTPEDIRQKIKKTHDENPSIPVSDVSVEVGANDVQLEEEISEEADSIGYKEVFNYLLDIEGSSEGSRLMSLLFGGPSQQEAGIEELREKFPEAYHQSVEAAVNDYIRNFEDRSDRYERFGYVDETHFITKRQIKEAKIRKMRNESTVYKKKDLRR